MPRACQLHLFGINLHQPTRRRKRLAQLQREVHLLADQQHAVRLRQHLREPTERRIIHAARAFHAGDWHTARVFQRLQFHAARARQCGRAGEDQRLLATGQPCQQTGGSGIDKRHGGSGSQGIIALKVLRTNGFQIGAGGRFKRISRQRHMHRPGPPRCRLAQRAQHISA